MKRIAILPVLGLALALCAPALAQAASPTDTVKLMVEKGNKLSVMDMEFDFTYKPDGTYTDPSGMGGKYRVDGNKLCLTPDALGQELCSEYPDGKKSGDKFDVQSDFGPLSITIK